MDDEIQLMAESWSEGTIESHEETKAMENQLPARPQPRPHQQGLRRLRSVL